jgi:FlaG/FlaF family flagellin (archaellin)
MGPNGGSARPADRRDDRAVTSVVGILLLVVVTVVVGATIGVFALQYGQQTTDVAPNAELDFEYRYFDDGVAKNDSITIVHTDGDTLDRSRLEVVVGNDTVFNDTGDSESNSRTNQVEGLIVEVDDGDFNDLNKPCRLSPPDTCNGPPGDGDGSDRDVVHQWEEEVQAGQRLVIQERNHEDSYDVVQPGERIAVVWHGEENSAVIAEETVAPNAAGGGS